MILFLMLLVICAVHPDDNVESSSQSPSTSCSNNTGNSEGDICQSVTTNVPVGDKDNATTLDINSTSDTESTENGTFTTEYDNETTLEVSTEIVSEVQTSPVPKVTTDISTTTVETVDTRPVPEDICTCDLLVDTCDINCCCDEDCSNNDLRVFSTCGRRASPPIDPRYCYQTQFIYVNHTELKMTRSTNGLFCIVRDNLPVQFHFKNRKAVTTLKDFKKLYERRRFHRWPSQDVRQLTFDPSTMYKAGNIVWSLQNATLVPLSMPTKVTSAFCQTSIPVRYLTDWTGMCSRAKVNCTSNTLNAATYFEGLAVIASPQFVNKTFLEQQECQNSTCIPVTTLLCPWSEHESTDMEDCLEDNIDSPEFDNDTNTCTNVVKQLKYLFYHNGTRGILKVEAYIWLTDLNFQQEEFSQSFSVSFLWANKTRKPFQRSGNPGYLIGKPVIAGRKIIHYSNEEDIPDKEAIELSEEHSKWLTIPKARHGGLCDGDTGESNRCSVMFGEDLRSSCSLSLNPSNFSSALTCSSVQKQVLLLLAGDAIENVTEAKDFNKYVATFGDSSVEETGDWVRILLENVPSFASPPSSKKNNRILICQNIITSLHIDVVFSNIGSVANPQSKILGVAFKFGNPRDLVFKCAPIHCANIGNEVHQRFEVLSSVSFLDITKQAITHFAEPPVYEVKLPHDFFYPFLSDSKGLTLNSCHKVIIIGLFISLY